MGAPVKEKLKETLTRDTIYDLYIIKNTRVNDIAKLYNTSRYTILRILKDYNITKPKDMAYKLTEETSLIKYGNKCSVASDICKAKSIQTCLAKYGVSSYMETDEFKEKAANNKNKIIKTILKRNNIPEECHEHFKDRETAIKYLTENNLTNKTPEELAELNHYTYSGMISLIARLDIKEYVNYIHGKSSYEKEITEYIRSLGITNIELSRRDILKDAKELDIYLPDYNIAIEFNGNYWHSDICKEKKYHFNKSKECESLGIRLIHIYQYEWDDTRIQPIIKSLLKIALKKVDSHIYARKCEVKEISNKEAKPFNDANHLQHHRNAEITYGLYYNDELVQLMSFSKHAKYGWEIVRGCPGSNNIVVGGVSKLFKHFIKKNNPDQVFSYCDFNKFDGKGYEAIGMTLIGYTDPDKTWIIGGKAIKRNARKYKEYKSKADGIIWGAGSKKYIWTKVEA